MRKVERKPGGTCQHIRKDNENLVVHDNILERLNENLVVHDNMLEKLNENLVGHDNVVV